MRAFRADLTSEVSARRIRFAKILLISIGSLALIGALTAALLWNALFAQMPQLPSKDALWSMNREPAMEFVDPTGRTLAIRGPRYGRRVDPADLPPHVVQAMLAVEDRRFYEHQGVDRLAILRAAISNWRAGRTTQGGSTLTQQLVKNLFLTPERTIRRKAQEARLSLQLEEMLTKDEILELYINRIYLGARAFGIDAAARRYFGKPPQELTVGEAAMIAGLPKAPSRFAPNLNPEAAKERQIYVLDRMTRAGFITEGAAERAAAEPVDITTESEDVRLGYALDWAADRARALIGENEPDLVVVMTLDSDTQILAHDKLNALLDAEGAEKDAEQGAVLVADPTGAVRAVVGGRSYVDSQFNRATQARRQPGSAFKAFVFAAALENGVQPHSVRYDEPIRIGSWRPKNYGGGYIGAATLSEAFAESINTIAVQLGQEVGTDNVINLARRFGVRSNLKSVPALALGAAETTLLDLTQAYGAFATEGQKFDVHLISEIRTSRGDVLYSRRDREPQQIFAQPLNRNMVGMMARVVSRGTGTAARLDEGRQVAGKTGTSQDWRDAWFVGFTADYVAGVWIGNDDDTPMKRVTGGDLPAQLWASVMMDLHEDRPLLPLPGAETANVLTTETERRIMFYRSVANAFAQVEARELQ